MQYNSLRTQAWLASLLLHAAICLLGVVCFFYQKNSSPSLLRSKQANYSYVMTNLVPQRKSLPVSKQIKTTRANSSQPLAQNRSSKHSSHFNERGHEHATLLNLLHQAIARKQIYPEQALLQNQSGKVTLAFNLEPNGQIDDIHIQQSSGSVSLDHSANQTIQAISPFVAAKQYLHQTEEFTLDIIYE